MYIKKTISYHGAKLDFATKLKRFLLENGVIPFELVSESQTNDFEFVVSYKKLKLSITLGNLMVTSTSVVVSHKRSDETYHTDTEVNIAHISSSSGEVIQTCALQFLLVKSKETIVVQIASYNATEPSKGLTVISLPLTSGEMLIGYGMYSNNGTALSFVETESSQLYTLRPYHLGTNNETLLIVSDSLAVNNSTNTYTANAIGLQSVGGAKQFNFYNTGTHIYYALSDNVCVNVGDKIEYTSVTDVNEVGEVMLE